jgi:hypothetical protein
LGGGLPPPYKRDSMAKIEAKKQNVQQGPRKMSKEDLARHIKSMKDRDSEMVSGVFKNLENPARGGSLGSVTFPYKAYEGDEVVIYEFYDGERYTIPRGVARHLNNDCYTREYGLLPGEFGKEGLRTAAHDGRLQTAAKQTSKKIHRFAFHSLEYTDDERDMYPADLIEVTNV